MNNMKHLYKYLLPAIVTCFLLLPQQKLSAQQPSGTLAIHFIHTANGKPVILHDSTYTNAFGEPYSLRKLRYYISHIELTGQNTRKEADPYHLVDLSKEPAPILLACDTGAYTGISMLAGIDSAAHCSGAQTGALDPINDMFWTWNSGYVIFKLEGESDSSGADLNRIEHHIGGYKDGNNVSVRVSLQPSNEQFMIRAGKQTDIFIETNLDRYWKGATDVRIKESPLCTTTGNLAKKIAANLPGLFSIQKIVYNP